MKEAIVCKYTCHACTLDKVSVAVPARSEERIEVWLKATAELLGADHCRRSPHCTKREIDLMIPIEGADKLGGPTRQTVQ